MRHRRHNRSLGIVKSINALPHPIRTTRWLCQSAVRGKRVSFVGGGGSVVGDCVWGTRRLGFQFWLQASAAAVAAAAAVGFCRIIFGYPFIYFLFCYIYIYIYIYPVDYPLEGGNASSRVSLYIP